MTTVIVCESDPEALQLACSLLKEMDCEVVPYHDGGLALERISTTEPDLVICDCFARSLNGIQLFSIMQDDPKLNLTPYILMCYKDMTDVGKAAGCSHILVKPFDSGAFREVVASALNSRDGYSR